MFSKTVYHNIDVFVSFLFSVNYRALRYSRWEKMYAWPIGQDLTRRTRAGTAGLTQDQHKIGQPEAMPI